MHVIIHLRKFYRPVCFPRNWKARHIKLFILPVVLYDCETWSLTSREEYRLRVFENKYLGRYLRLRKTKLQENGENYTMLSYMHYILRLTYN